LTYTSPILSVFPCDCLLLQGSKEETICDSEEEEGQRGVLHDGNYIGTSSVEGYGAKVLELITELDLPFDCIGLLNHQDDRPHKEWGASWSPLNYFFILGESSNHNAARWLVNVKGVESCHIECPSQVPGEDTLCLRATTLLP